MTAVTSAVSFLVACLCGMGAGGGGLMVLYLTAMLKISQAEAQGINLLFFLSASVAFATGLKIHECSISDRHEARIVHAATGWVDVSADAAVSWNRYCTSVAGGIRNIQCVGEHAPKQQCQRSIIECSGCWKIICFLKRQDGLQGVFVK